MDVNRDGLPDLLWQEITTGKILYWIMSGTQMTSSFYFPQGQQSGLAGWTLVGPANPNGGPKSELISQLKGKPEDKDNCSGRGLSCAEAKTSLGNTKWAPQTRANLGSLPC